MLFYSETILYYKSITQTSQVFSISVDYDKKLT